MAPDTSEFRRRRTTTTMAPWDGVKIPKKSRYSKGNGAPVFGAKVDCKEFETLLMSEYEAATILIQLANSAAREIHGVENKIRKRKRKCRKIKEQTEPLAKKSKSKKELILVPNDMPSAMKNRIAQMGGHGIELVMQKKLQDTDLNPNHNRLSIPPKKVRYDFLTEDEKVELTKHCGKKVNGMNVWILDQNLRETAMGLKKWKIGNSKVYCLMTEWSSFVRDNLLEKGDYIQLWSFRVNHVDISAQMVNSELGFAIVKVPMD